MKWRLSLFFSPSQQPLGGKLSSTFSRFWHEYESGKGEGERACQAGLGRWDCSKKWGTEKGLIPLLLLVGVG